MSVSEDVGQAEDQVVCRCQRTRDRLGAWRCVGVRGGGTGWGPGGVSVSEDEGQAEDQVVCRCQRRRDRLRTRRCVGVRGRGAG